MNLTCANGSNSISMSVEMNGIVYTGKTGLPPANPTTREEESLSALSRSCGEGLGRGQRTTRGSPFPFSNLGPGDPARGISLALPTEPSCQLTHLARLPGSRVLPVHSGWS